MRKYISTKKALFSTKFTKVSFLIFFYTHFLLYFAKICIPLRCVGCLFCRPPDGIRMPAHGLPQTKICNFEHTVVLDYSIVSITL